MSDRYYAGFDDGVAEEKRRHELAVLHELPPKSDWYWLRATGLKPCIVYVNSGAKLLYLNGKMYRWQDIFEHDGELRGPIPNPFLTEGESAN